MVSHPQNPEFRNNTASFYPYNKYCYPVIKHAQVRKASMRAKQFFVLTISESRALIRLVKYI